MALESFEVETSGQHLWAVLNKNAYSERALQAACELIDNAISAILTMLTMTNIPRKILFQFDEEGKRASIEDNGPGFPTNPDALKRCWSYGHAKPGGLNEHGCGAKTALSIFDVKGDGWQAYWKSPDSSTIYKIQGPLRSKMTVTQVSTWPGTLTDATGVYMSFPCSNECFRSLYGPNTKNMGDAIARFRSELSQLYSYQTNILDGTIRLEVNGQRVEPFQFPLDQVLSHKKFEIPLDATNTNKAVGMVVHHATAIKDSWFKVTQSSMGIYIWKNGRLIMHINAGDTFEQIAGRRPHPTLSGRIVLVNLIGDQLVLPATDPNKTRFMTDTDAFRAFVEKLRPIVAPHFTHAGVDEVYERDLVREYVDGLRLHRETVLPGYSCSVNKSLNGDTPPIDIVEEFPGTNAVRIYEAKRSDRASIDSIGQLVVNYLLARHSVAPSGRTIDKAILLLNCGSATSPLDPTLEARARTLMETTGCPLEIHSYTDGLLWPRLRPAPAVAPVRGRGRPRKVTQSTA